MYISILIQFGIFGILAVIFAIHNIYSKNGDLGEAPRIIRTAESKIVIGAIAITSILVEVLDYQLAMLCVALLISRANLDLNKIYSNDVQKNWNENLSTIQR